MKFLQSKMVSSTVWVLGGYGATQTLRLISNLILTRLLVPEMFGLMTLVNSIILGAILLSDVGVRDSIINTKHDSDSRFLETAWTIQVVRGLCIFLGICAIAHPLESYFQYTDLSELLMVCGLTVIINGCVSVKIFLLEKRLEFRPQIIIEVIANILGIIVMVGTALFYQSVWCLVAGMLVQSVCHVLFSHLVLSGPKVRFGFDWASAKNIIHLGKWIFLSTAALYATYHGDKLILAKMITPAELGVYSIAAIFGYVFKDIIANMSGKMLLPVYRNVVEDGQPLQKILKSRLGILALAFVGAMVLSATGELLITHLYDERYANAGWILQLLAFAGLCHSFDDTIRGFLMANRDSFHSFCVQALKGCVFIALALWLTQSYGIIGMLMAMALAPLVVFPYLMYVVSLHGYRWFYIDIVIVVFSSVSFILLWYFLGGTLWLKLTDLLNNLSV